jgi:hypothetical protein
LGAEYRAFESLHSDLFYKWHLLLLLFLLVRRLLSTLTTLLTQAHGLWLLLLQPFSWFLVSFSTDIRLLSDLHFFLWDSLLLLETLLFDDAISFVKLLLKVTIHVLFKLDFVLVEFFLSFLKLDSLSPFSGPFSMLALALAHQLVLFDHHKVLKSSALGLFLF